MSTYGNPDVKKVVKELPPACSVCRGRFMSGAGVDNRNGGVIKCWFDMFPRP